MLNINRYIASSGYDRIKCWGNPVALPVGGTVFVLAQKLLIKATDCFSDLSMLKSSDGGKSWSSPQQVAHLAGFTDADGIRHAYLASSMRLCANGKILVILTTFNYNSQNRLDRANPQRVNYLYFDIANDSWSELRELKLDAPANADVLAVDSQLVKLDSDYLLPYCVKEESSKFYSRIARINISDDGTLTPIDYSEKIQTPVGRGFLEPSLCRFAGKYYLSLRNDQSGHISASKDWKHFSEIKPLCFDDGSDLGNYNTMTRLLTIGNKLYLVYTRKGLNNDHIFRHRAPLIIGEVDPQSVSIVRASEQIAVPEHGARLGNFTAAVSPENSGYISVAEWMQTLEPERDNCLKCEEYGSDNRIWFVTLKTSSDQKE